MTPIWDDLVDQHGDPLDSLPWQIAEASWLFAKWLTWNPSALRHPHRAYTIADVDSMRWARRARLASVSDVVAPVLKDSNLRVIIGSIV